jgi:alkylation response protein AidB-like acyl-CoA dehydrogenase
MQLCGAVGLTYEHHLHRYVERGAILAELLGSTRHLEQELGRSLIEGLRAPPVVQL